MELIEIEIHKTSYGEFLRFLYITLGLKMLIFLRLKNVFETDILKCWCSLPPVKIIMYLFSMNNYSVKSSQNYKNFMNFP